MRREGRQLLIILIFAVLSAVLLAAVHSGRAAELTDSEGVYFLGSAQVVSEDTFEEIKQGRRPQDFDSEALKWNGEPAPSDEESQTYYLAQNPDNADWEGTILPAYSGARLYLLEDSRLERKSDAIEEGYAFAFVVADRASYIEGSIVFTGLPTVSIDYEDGEITAREEHSGRITVIDSAGGEASTTRCSFHVRGNTSAHYDKKNFRISLCDSRGRSRKQNYLGIREDDDWILNALYTDRTRAREKVCYSLWEEINALEEVPTASSSMQYVELFLNHEYRGLYGLMVPVDGMQMGMEQGDLLYKVRTWMREYTAQGDLTDYDGQAEIPNANGYNYAEIKYPNGPSGAFLWEPMQAWQDFVYETQNLQTLTDAGVTPDRNNLILHNLFCVLVHAGDNTWKNTFLAFYSDGDGGYTLRETIWDLNYTFGDEFVLDYSIGNTVFRADSAQSVQFGEDMDYGYAALLSSGQDTARETEALWEKWRQSGITAESVWELFEDSEETLRRSGAGRREAERWPGSCAYAEEAFEEVHAWILARFRYLDSYYAPGV